LRRRNAIIGLARGDARLEIVEIINARRFLRVEMGVAVAPVGERPIDVDADEIDGA
jgi:hypothetical protein